MDTLRSLDYSLFLFLNGLHNSALDFIMWWVSDRWIWIPFYAFLVWFIYRHYPKHALSLLISIAILITLSDQLASTVVKNAVTRLRPCHNPEIASQVHLVNGYCGGMYGFVSSHAANSFALVTFLGLLFQKKHNRLKWVLFFWATLISYSRVYLGAHFPADVLCGALLGIVLAIVIYRLYKIYSSQFLHISENTL